MATSALTPALTPALFTGWDNGVQQVGSEGRDKSDVGAPAIEPSYAEGPLLQAPSYQSATEIYVDDSVEAYEPYGDYLDHTPWPNYEGDPDRPTDLDGPDSGHDWDQGAPAAIREVGHPDIGKPVLQHYTMRSTERQPVFSPNGQMVEEPGSREPNVMNWYDDQNIDIGIGYYVQETERPLYSQVAQVPGQYDEPAGQFQPDHRYSDTIYNDGGIPTAYVTPPDPPVNPLPAQGSVPDDYYGAY